VVFTRMEQMGLQQELYGSCFTASPVRGRSEQSTSPLSSQPSVSPLSSQPSQFHSCEETVINDDLSDYHESEDPLASLLSLPPPPLGMIVASNDKNDIDSLFSHPSHHEARSTFTTLTLQLLHCRDCTNRHHFISTVLSTSVTIASCMPLTIVNSTAQIVEASDFNPSGG
jgi:hypothetical protein